MRLFGQAGPGLENLQGDILLADGIIKKVGEVKQEDIDALGKDLVTVNAEGAWVTPG